MIKLYQFATSPFCEKVRRILNYKGQPYTIIEVQRAKVPEYRAASPHGKFPALEHDGVYVWDSTNIAHHIEAAFPDPPLIPRNPRAAALVHVFEDWADESLYFYEMTMRLAWDHNIDRVLPEFAAGVPGMPLEKLRRIMLANVQANTTAQGLGRKHPQEVVDDVARHFAALEALLDGGDWLTGDRLTLADIAVACQVRALVYATEAEELLSKSPRLAAWMARVDLVAPPGGPTVETLG